MLHWLAGLTVVLTAADHWTTYLCLRGPVAGWHVSEVNPLADWLFATLTRAGAADRHLDHAGRLASWCTRSVPRSAKSVCFGVLFVRGLCVLNNLRAIEALGLSPLGAI